MNLIKKIFVLLYSNLRIYKYKLLSKTKNIQGKPVLVSPLVTQGNGKIIFHKNVIIGVRTSQLFYSNYAYIESRGINSLIEINNNVKINNNVCIVSDGEGIFIDENTLIGTNVTITDSNFHDLNPLFREFRDSNSKKVNIGKNVFIGSNVTILKGASIGDNSVIATGSIVTGLIPSNVIAGGTPCRVLKNLDY